MLLVLAFHIRLSLRDGSSFKAHRLPQMEQDSLLHGVGVLLCAFSCLFMPPAMGCSSSVRTIETTPSTLFSRGFLSNPQNLDISHLIQSPRESPFARALEHASEMLVVPNHVCSLAKWWVSLLFAFGVVVLLIASFRGATLIRL